MTSPAPPTALAFHRMLLNSSANVFFSVHPENLVFNVFAQRASHFSYTAPWVRTPPRLLAAPHPAGRAPCVPPEPRTLGLEFANHYPVKAIRVP